MKTIAELTKEKPWLPWALFSATLVIVFLSGLFLSSIFERRLESLIVYTPNMPFKDFEPRSALWGKYFPREYETWKKTENMDFKSKYNGNTQVDALSEDPRMVILWAGYPFSKAYSKPRGHAYTIKDIRETLRTGAPKNDNDGPLPNTCWTCKSPDVPRIMQEIGAAEFYKGTWASRGSEVVNPIGCADCHDPKTMNLRIARPALVEAFDRQHMDISKMEHKDKRSLVCAQCHVEYYFKGKDKYLTFPWDKGMTVEKMEEYYDEIEFSDWTHALSKTPMLKAQHPDFELFKLGVHGQRGLSCADCHMPYVSEGAAKFSNHQIMSPLANVSRTCQVCHRESEETLKASVEERQDKVQELKIKTEDVLVKAHFEAKKAWDLGATDQEMKPILKLIRHASWRWDFAVAGHGSSFHAPLEVLRILGTALDKAHEARLELSKVLVKHGMTSDIVIPDISTKDKAQMAIGLDMKKLQEEKKVFLDTLVPEWDKRAKMREDQYEPKLNL